MCMWLSSNVSTHVLSKHVLVRMMMMMMMMMTTTTTIVLLMMTIMMKIMGRTSNVAIPLTKLAETSEPFTLSPQPVKSHEVAL